MDVSSPITTVVPSLDGAVLEVLARAGKPLTGRQVQRLARRGSIPGVSTVLSRLSDAGLVICERAGAANLYQANREHLAWPAVETLVGIRAALLERIRGLMTAWDNAPAHAALFGSTARGDGDSASDIDILIVHKSGAAPSESEIDSMRSSVTLWTGNHAQIVVVDESTWAQMTRDKDPIVESVRTDGINLLEGSERAA